jgi:hypothetical protein
MLLGVFLLGAVSLIFIAKKANNSLDADLKMTKSNADSLLKVTGSLDEGIKKVKGRNDSLSLKNGELEKSLARTNSKLAAKEGEIQKNKIATDEANKKYDNIVASQKDLNKQLVSLKTLNDQLGQENKNLTSKAATLSEKNNQLNDKLQFAMISTKDNVLIETTSKSGKLNLKGKKVRKIVASMNTHGEMKNPTFKIFDHNGVQLSEQTGSFSVKKSNESSADSPLGNTMKLELTYLPSKKIGPGLYKIEISNENKHIGNLLVRFR